MSVLYEGLRRIVHSLEQTANLNLGYVSPCFVNSLPNMITQYNNHNHQFWLFWISPKKTSNKSHVSFPRPRPAAGHFVSPALGRPLAFSARRLRQRPAAVACQSPGWIHRLPSESPTSPEITYSTTIHYMCLLNKQFDA